MFGTAPIIENQDDKKEEQKAVDIIKDNVSMFETEEEFKSIQPYGKYILLNNLINKYKISKLNII